MTRHNLTARVENLAIGVIAAITLLLLIAYSQAKDKADRATVCAQAEQQARDAAQSDTWARLDKQGRDMIAFDQIKK